MFSGEKGQETINVPEEAVRAIENLEGVTDREKAELLLILAGLKPATILLNLLARKVVVDGETYYFDESEDADKNKEESDLLMAKLREQGLHVAEARTESRDDSELPYELDGQEGTAPVVREEISLYVARKEREAEKLKDAHALQYKTGGDMNEYHRAMGQALGYKDAMIEDFLNGTTSEEGSAAQEKLHRGYLNCISKLSPTLHAAMIEEKQFD